MFEGEDLITKDVIYNILFEPSDDDQLDSLTIMALELISTEMLIILERQAKDQLPGGHHWEPTNQVLKAGANCPTTNAISERDFALLDYLLRIKPSANLSTMETIILWINNKPMTWFLSLPPKKQESVLADIRLKLPSLRMAINDKKMRLVSSQKDKLKEKQQKQEDKTNKAQKNAVQFTRDLVAVGGLWSLEDIRKKKNDFSKENYRKALLAQIKYHQHVIGTQAQKDLFTKSTNKQLKSLEQLESNLIQIVSVSHVENTKASGAALKYKSPQDQVIAIAEKRAQLFQRLFAEREKRRVAQQRDKLPIYITDPSLLVGKIVEHQTVQDNNTCWWRGEVVGIHKTFQSTIRTEFNIKYVDFPSEIWHFPLLQDLKNGDLIIY
uniref:Uncharacterized protein n=1 Tax=Biomphalaria glabrata TaxID=6526 RepID=A0A2C9KLX8_BIOGL